MKWSHLRHVWPHTRAPLVINVVQKLIFGLRCPFLVTLPFDQALHDPLPVFLTVGHRLMSNDIVNDRTVIVVHLVPGTVVVALQLDTTSSGCATRRCSISKLCLR